MKKGISILAAGLLVAGMVSIPVHAEDQEQKKDTDEDCYEEVQSNLPWKQEVKGSMYGYMLGIIKKPEPVIPGVPDEDDIIIDVQPTDPFKPGTEDETTKNEPSSNIGKVPDIETNKKAEANQNRYSEEYKEQELKRVGYYWNDRTEQLTISRKLLSKAKADKRDIYLYVEAEQKYRIHIAYGDIRNTDKDITIDLSECRHLAKIQKTAGKDILWILQCQKDSIDMKIYVAVKIPDSWKDKILYLYEYKEGKFVLQETKIKADKEGYAEVLLKHGVDQIITDSSITDRNLSSWVEGLTGENMGVNQMYAIISLGAFLTAVAGIIYLFKKRQSNR